MRNSYKRCVSLAAMIVGALAVVSSPGGAVYITQEQAMQAVRDFEGNQSLQFSEIVFQPDPTQDWNVDLSDFVLRTGDIPEHEWEVGGLSGEVLSARYDENSPADSSDTPPGPLSQAQCETIALNYARAKYVGFDGMNFQLETPTWTGFGWEFKWLHRLQYDALTLNHVYVTVNDAAGEMESYSAMRVPVTPPNQPQLTSQQAIDAAKVATGIVTEDTDDRVGPTLIANPAGLVYWVMQIAGTDSQGGYTGWAVTLNAQTGSVLEQLEAGSGTRVIKSASGWESAGPDALRARPVRELAAQMAGGRIDWVDGKGAKLTVGGCTFWLRPGSSTVDRTDRKVQIQLMMKMYVQDGHLMVPAELTTLLKKACAT